MAKQKYKNMPVWCPLDLVALIEKRAEACNESKSSYAALVLQHWVKIGCPPVSRFDEMAQGIASLTKNLPGKSTAPAETPGRRNQKR